MSPDASVGRSSSYRAKNALLRWLLTRIQPFPSFQRGWAGRSRFVFPLENSALCSFVVESRFWNLRENLRGSLLQIGASPGYRKEVNGHSLDQQTLYSQPLHLKMK